MKRADSAYVLFVVALLLLVSNCRQVSNQQQPLALKEDSAVFNNEELTRYKNVCDSIESKLGKLPTLSSVCELAERIIQFKDSLEIAHNSYGTLNQEDSLFAAPLDKKGYETILAYKRLCSFRIPAAAEEPGIIRGEGITDSLSRAILPKAGTSSFFAGKQFFFLGGGPFISRVQGEEGHAVFKDADGKPEIRFSCNVNENTLLLLDALSLVSGVNANIKFGPPLYSYDMGMQEVYGIGSLIHEFQNRLPVYFITETGIVEGKLVSINNKLVPEAMGCVSDNPNVIFACSSLPAKEILGVFIPFDQEPLTTCKINRKRKLWTADFNSDGIPDMACVSDTFIGMVSDNMARIVWYINIDGNWKVIDRAEELDCT